MLESEKVAAVGHQAGKFETVREAECLKSGLREKKRLVCGATVESETSDALGHSYTEWETTIEATKEWEGERMRHCVHCGETQTEKIEKLPKFLGIF